MRARRALIGGAVLGVLVAGCGSQHAGGTGSGGSAARTAGQAAAARAAAGMAAAEAGGRTTVSARARVVAGIGTIPSWLPVPTPPSNQVVTATPQRTVRAAIEGNTVIAALPGARAEVTVVGPQVPARFTRAVQSGHRSMALPVPARFIASFVVRHGQLRLTSRAFTVRDENGQIHGAELRALNGGPPPAVLRAGQHANLALLTTLVPGDGGVRWAPGGSEPLITWDFVLEVD